MKKSLMGKAVVIFALTFVPGQLLAATVDDYCIIPSFMKVIQPPNLLLMIDNSASMYDLSYADDGYKTCSTTTTTYCTADSECPSGETCSRFLRQPYYCFDETYKNSRTYAGYFDPINIYKYRLAPTDDFLEVETFPAGCPTSSSNTSKTIPSTMCIEYSTSGTTKTLVSFVAKGNYLNWLTSSKFDVEKDILTGGKYDGSHLLAESRGCVGRGFVKDANTADFVNYASSNPNTALEVTFTVHGPANPNSPSAPSPGGQTFITIFGGKPYDYASCQAAITAIATGGNADVKQSVANCLSSSVSGYCQQEAGRTCFASYPDCNPPFVAAHCDKKPAQSCTDNASCMTAATTGCSALPTKQCSADSDCAVAEKKACDFNSSQTCTTDEQCFVPAADAVQGHCRVKDSFKCYVDADCVTSKGIDNGPCDGAVSPGAHTCRIVEAAANYGTCDSFSSIDYGPCNLATGGSYVGPCVFGSQEAATKTKVAFQQSMQACWALREGHPIGNDEVNSVKNQCSDIYGGYKTCSNDHSRVCSGDADCGSGGTCVDGPPAIAPGSTALLCGSSYEGQFYEKNSNGAWVLKTTATDADIIDVHEQFCSDLLVPNVIDPTDAPSDTTITDNVPAILSSVGVEAQLGSAIGTMKVRLAKSTPPSGLVQTFGSRIRMGLMTFNQFGSASETALLGTPMVCSHDETMSCTQDVDCGTGNTCSATTSSNNLDGAKVLHEIGKGTCATMTVNACTADSDCASGQSCLNKLCGTKSTTVCATDTNCTSPAVCVSSGVGDYTVGLIQTLNGIRAGSWTPFAEGFYNAIGYFARTSSGASRTALRLNDGDFDSSLNPSQYRCQQNFTLLITDGSSTADRNSNVDNLALLYASLAGKASGWTSTCDNYAGSKNLPIMSWIGKHEKISDFSLASSATAAPNPLLLDSRDVMTSFVVSTGASNGEEGECNSINMLSETAVNGGTTLRQANNPEELQAKIEAIFDEIERQSASGTAASILSNSQGSGANILQAVFHPRKKFLDGGTSSESTWVGEIHNLWYYIDPRLGNSTIREDTDFSSTSPNHVLNLQNDYIVSFFFDPITSQTMVRRSRDTDGNGSGDVDISGTMSPDSLSAIWRAGELLWQRDVSVAANARQIKTAIGTTLIDFSTTNAETLQPYLQAATIPAAEKIINYVNGIDYLSDATMRPRTVSIGGSTGVWKLGDIVSSTPRLLSSGQLNLYDTIYRDESYKSFINSNNYKSRGMVFAGANDGMMHAFKLGKLSTTNNTELAAANIQIQGVVKAALTGSNLGKEEWAFIPKNALPYLTYLKDKSYEDKHIYFIDGPTVLFDASIGSPDDCATDYWTCDKFTEVVTEDKDLDATKNPWRSIMIGSMGIGGATHKSCTGLSSCVETPRADPANASKGLGYSSYFALDITDPTNPTLLWEFAHEELGFSTTGPAIIRIGPKNKNGRWYAIFGSGPTGPIDTVNRQFMARSNQGLKLFILDLKTGTLLRKIDASETYSDLATAYAGPMVGAQIDTDRWDPTSNGYYKDDALHFGYVKNDSDVTPTTWTQGGVMRLTTRESDNPDDWFISKVIDNIGPVTTTIARLVERKNQRLWLYFGTGRYYHKMDDNGTRRAIFGIKEPCYTVGNDLNADPTATCYTGSLLSKSDLDNQSADNADDSIPDHGWVIDLDIADDTFGAERIVTDPVALINGTVFFTSFKPTPDVCGYGGSSLMWVTKFDTGVAPPSRVMVGKILLQLSTGTFKEINISDAFTARGGRRTDDSLMLGKPPGDPPPVITNAGNKPVKKILHIQEK